MHCTEMKDDGACSSVTIEPQYYYGSQLGEKTRILFVCKWGGIKSTSDSMKKKIRHEF